MSPHPVMFKEKKKTNPTNSCSLVILQGSLKNILRHLWGQVTATCIYRRGFWVLNFRCLQYLTQHPICSTAELSGEIPVGICTQPWCGRAHLFPPWILTDSQLSSLLQFLSAASDDVSDFSWPCKSQQAPGQTRTHLPKESCRRSDIPLLSHWAHPSNFFPLFSPPPVPFCLVWPWSLMTRLLFLPNQSIS